ncbi:DotU family type IV/VI secretion system protein [Serratia sp. DD3]|uniref:DotU family type IV/VI secretion system protein n=1 Tax=Serratia sp. DD3 TaxID=1410619 RepID=UPI0009DD795E|nr:DotU family type IV/VI secretion system protein [Serratia sp. DD3]
MMGLSLFIVSIADNPVVLINTLLQDTWMLLLVVKNNPSVFVSKAVYRQPTALVQHGVRKCHIDTITYGQCALLDETVLTRRSHTINNLNQEVNPTWHAMPLQARFFLRLMRATSYWTTLKPSCMSPLIRPYCTLVCCGFRSPSW